MIECRECEPLFVEAFYNEINSENRRLLEAHLKTCAKCAAEYSGMKATLNLMNQREHKEPTPGFFENYLPNLEKRIEEQKGESETKVISWRRNLNTRYAWVVRLAAAIAFISIGILIGKHIQNQQPTQTIAAVSLPPAVGVVPASADERAMRYLKRSQVLLLGLVNNDPDQTGSVPDFSRKKAISKELVQEASVLKQDLNNPNQRRLKELVSDLEVILIQIANLEEKNDMPQIELLKSGVDRKEILLKINLEEMRRIDSAPATETKSATGKPVI
jgi:hypothetical protein